MDISISSAKQIWKTSMTFDLLALLSQIVRDFES